MTGHEDCQDCCASFETRLILRFQGKGADLNPPKISSLASPHRPKASDGSMEPSRRGYYKLKEPIRTYDTERSEAI